MNSRNILLQIIWNVCYSWNLNTLNSVFQYNHDYWNKESEHRKNSRPLAAVLLCLKNRVIKTNFYKRKNLKCFLCVLCFLCDPCGKNHLSCFSICSLRSLGTLRLNSLLLFVFILFVAIGYAVLFLFLVVNLFISENNKKFRLIIVRSFSSLFPHW